MVVCATTHDGKATLDEFVGQHLCVLLYLLCPLLELRLQSLAKGNGLSGDDVFQRATLLTREYGTIEQG